ncbi:MAG: DUF3179 domain-containing (seleno)protein [Bacteroidota bacterium]
MALLRLFNLILLKLIILFPGFSQQYARGLHQQWNTNLNRTSIPLRELHGFIPRNAISPIYHSNFWNKRQAENQFFPKEPVVVVVVKSIEKAYPLSVLTYHQVINDKVANIPIAVTYCPLSGTINVYDRRVEAQGKTKILEFGVSGMLRFANTIMWDHETESWWQQANGKALVGDLNGAELSLFPFMVLSYEKFYENYPYGLIMDYHIDKAVTYGTTPYYQHDDISKNVPNLYLAEPPLKLVPREKVIVTSSMGDQIIYPVDLVKSFGVLNDTPNNNYVAIFYANGVVSTLDQKNFKDSKDVGTCVVFSAFHKTRRLTFKKKDEGFIDEQTGSVWDITGKCIQGPLKNDQLRLLKYRDMFAFTALSMWPEGRIFGESY